MKTIWTLVKKDVRRLAPGALVLALLGLAQIALGAYLLVDHLPEGFAKRAEKLALGFAILEGLATWLLALAQVQLDAPTRTNALGRVLPLSGGGLLVAKVLGAAVLMGLVPWLVRLPWWAFANLDADEWVYQSAFLWTRQGVVVLFAMLLASLVNRFARAILWSFVLAAGVVVASVVFEAFLSADLGEARRLAYYWEEGPNPMTQWNQRFAVAVSVLLLGMTAVVIWQYLTRRTAISLAWAGGVLAVAGFALVKLPGWTVVPTKDPSTVVSAPPSELEAAVQVEFRGRGIHWSNTLALDWAVSVPPGWTVQGKALQTQAWTADGPLTPQQFVGSDDWDSVPWAVLLEDLIPAGTPEVDLDEETRRALLRRSVRSTYETQAGRILSLQKHRTAFLWPDETEGEPDPSVRVRTELEVEMTRIEIMRQGPLSETGWQRSNHGAFRILKGQSKPSSASRWYKTPFDAWHTGVAITAGHSGRRLAWSTLASGGTTRPLDRPQVLLVDGLFRDGWQMSGRYDWRSFAGVSVQRIEFEIVPGSLGFDDRPTASPITEEWIQNLRYAVLRKHEKFQIQRLFDIEQVKIWRADGSAPASP